MPARCSVPGCSTKAKAGSGPRFYCIPSEINYSGKSSSLRVSRRKKWISALKLEHFSDVQLKNIRICGHHFISGKPADQYFVHHPDWVPSQNLGSRSFRGNSSITKTRFVNKPNLDTSAKKHSGSPMKKHGGANSPEVVSMDIQFEEGSKYSMPQKRCCVASCLNRMSKTKNASPAIYYHKFPEEPLTRQRWMFLCQRKGTWDPDHCYICSEHFLPEDFSNEGELKALSVPKTNLLSNYSNAKDEKSLIQVEGNYGVCSVPWCRSKRLEQKKMIPFPEEKEIQQTWIDKIFGPNVPVQPSNNCFICQDHFSKDQWVNPSDVGGLTLVDGAVPCVFTVPQQTVKEKIVVRRISDMCKKKEPKTKHSDQEENEKSADSDEDLGSSSTIKKVSVKQKEIKDSENEKNIVKLVKIIKNNHFVGDHTYFGSDSPDLSLNENDNHKKRIAETPIKSGINKRKRTVSIIDVNDSLKDVQDLMADLMDDDDDDDDDDDGQKNNTKPKKHVKSIRKEIVDSNEDQSDSLGDYSDYSESDSDSDKDESELKNLDNMSEKELKELAEAQKDQLDDLKSENKELIEENEILRKSLNSVQSDPNYSALIAEKHKFLALMAKLFRNFLNEDQILSLLKSSDPSVVITWSGETINKALKIIDACSDNGYDQLLTLGFPLPSRRLLSQLHRNKSAVETPNDNKKNHDPSEPAAG